MKEEITVHVRKVDNGYIVEAYYGQGLRTLAPQEFAGQIGPQPENTSHVFNTFETMVGHLQNVFN